jgi:hypothetical protein
MGSSSVFISYRRQLSEQLALLVRMELTEHHFDTFVDLKNLDSGEFKRTILSQIEAREHFIVLLQPGSLDRIGEDDDWLRREIAHALAHDRNVVPWPLTDSNSALTSCCRPTWRACRSSTR